MVTLDTPITPPVAAAAESTSSTLRMPGRWPSSSSRSPEPPTATTVPMVSKKSLMNSAKIVGISATASASRMLCQASESPIVEKEPAPGHSATPLGPFNTPKISPSAVLVSTPIRIEPRMFRALSTAAVRTPPSAIRGGPAVRSPSAMPVAGSLITMPPSRRPTRVMNRPMPTPIASFIDSGMARMIASRRPTSTSTSARRPSTTMHDMPTGHATLWPRMMSNATTAFRPSPVASANG